ncbi:MAG: terpene cyclase/mutase family protein, partial [Firmicutes bacterium]|nr:terpene cyclase/mutase family protein [Bacillota bacterium]
MKKVLFKSKAFILLLIMALLFCMAPQFAFTAYADETASFEVNASECSVIGEYMDGDVYYCVAPEGTAEVVFKDYEGNMEEGMITGLQSGMVEGTNVAPVSGEFRATWETMNSNDSIEFAEGAEDLDYSNAYFYFIMDDDYEMASFVVQVTTPPADDTVFTSNVGVISGPEEDAYAYVFYDPSQGWAPVNATADLYTLTVPYGTQEVTLDFGETKTISYNYDADGNYLYGWYDDSTIGETTTTKKVDSNKDSIPDYIWVQNPYNADYTGGELLYVIKLEYSYTFKCSVDGKEMTEISFTPENYSYTDWLGVTSIVGTYTVTLPYGTEKVDLDFSDNVLCYNYTKDGNYLGGYYVDFETGGKEAHGIPVDYSDAMTPADGEFDYIQVQTPYDEAYNSTLLYTVTFEYVNPPFTTDNGTITGPVKGGYQYTAYVYDPEDPEADSYGYVAKPGEADLFTVNLSSLKDVKDITISFLMDETISYNYDEYGNFLAGKYADPTVGETETTKPIDSNNDGVLDYIWVQHPYNADYSGGELIYVIKLSYVPCAEKIKDVYDMLVTQADKLMSDDANAAYGVGDWFIFDQARDGRDVNPNYLESVKKYVNDHEGDLVNGGNYYSNYSRTILAMTALGADARTFTDYNLLEYLADFKNVKAQGLNGVIWALLAVDCHVYEIPEVEGVAEEDLTTNDMMINYILDAFLEDGGWALRGTTPDVDITAMAIASLAPYMFDDNVNEKVEKAVQWLSDNQNDDGSFSALNPDGTTIPTAESTAMVAIALSSLGIDPA